MLRKFKSNKLNQLCILYKTKSKFRLGETSFVTRYDYRRILLLFTFYYYLLLCHNLQVRFSHQIVQHYIRVEIGMKHYTK